MIDMCRMSTTYTDHHGAYLVTPDFPFSYAYGRHCACTLRAVPQPPAGRDGDQGGLLALEFVHVRLRHYETPADTCHDWINVQVHSVHIHSRTSIHRYKKYRRIPL